MLGIKSLIIKDDQIENKTFFYLLVGPFFLSLLLLIAPIKLSIVALVGLFLCYRFQKKGLLLSNLLLITYFFVNHLTISSSHLFNIGMELSVALSFLITAFAFEEVSAYFDDFQDEEIEEEKEGEDEKEFKQLEESQRKLQSDINKLQFEYDEKIAELKSIQNLNDTLRKSLEETTEQKDILSYEALQKDRKIAELSVDWDNNQIEKIVPDEKVVEELNNLKQKYNELTSEKENLLKQLENLPKEIDDQEINAAEKEIEKLKKENEALKALANKDVSQEILEKDQLIEDMQTKVKDFNKVNSLYLQLREQFNEKSDVLHKTRSDLFHAQEELAAYKKEKEKDYSDFTDQEKQLVEDLQNTQDELEESNCENESLKEIVTELNHKIDDKKPNKKVKPKDTEGEQLSLYD